MNRSAETDQAPEHAVFGPAARRFWGGLKIAYDLSLLRMFSHINPPEEMTAP